MKKSSRVAITQKPSLQRTCIGCRQIHGKGDMVRLVRTIDGTIEIDTTGKRDGRGAYLCPDWDCWETALSGKQMERAFHSRLTPNNRQQLVAHGKELIKEITSG